MKKIALLIALMLSATGAMAQKNVETVYLKNGGIVKGDIIEQVPGQSLKIKTKDGNVFVYQMDEVERITKEEKSVSSASGHKGLDFSVNAGYDIATKGGSGDIVTELELGKRFSKNIYWGFGAGANFSTTSGGGIVVPITTNIKTFFPLESSSFVPFAMLKAGYALNTDDTDYSGILLSVMPGVQFPLSKTVDMSLGAGYSHVIYDKGNGGAISIRMGFNFHNSPDHVKKPLLPSKSNALQLTIETNSNPNPVDIDGGAYGTVAQLGLNAVLSYKLTPQLMFGVGAGYGFFNIEEPDYEDQKNDIYYFGIDGPLFKGFVRGLYRFSDRRFSPFISCDLGMRFYSPDHGQGHLEEIGESTSFSGLFVAPALGLSLRTSNNSYLDLTVGYDFSEKKSWDCENYNNYKKYESGGMSSPFIRLGFTRTFGK